jgi:hypothetical protein
MAVYLNGCACYVRIFYFGTVEVKLVILDAVHVVGPNIE